MPNPADGLLRRWQGPHPAVVDGQELSAGSRASPAQKARSFTDVDVNKIIEDSGKRLAAAEQHFKRFCAAAMEVKTAMAVTEARLAYTGRALSKGTQPIGNGGGVSTFAAADAARRSASASSSRAGSSRRQKEDDCLEDSLFGLHLSVSMVGGGGFGATSRDMRRSGAGGTQSSRGVSASPSRASASGRSPSLVSSSAASSPPLTSRRGGRSEEKKSSKPADTINKPFRGVASPESPLDGSSSSPLGVRPSLQKHLYPPPATAGLPLPIPQKPMPSATRKALQSKYAQQGAEGSTAGGIKPQTAAVVVPPQQQKDASSFSSSAKRKFEMTACGPPSSSAADRSTAEARMAEKRLSQVISSDRRRREDEALRMVSSRGTEGRIVGKNPSRRATPARQQHRPLPSSPEREPRVLSHITLISATSAIDLSSDSDY